MGELKKYTNCTTGGPVWVHIRDGVVEKITPLTIDDSDAASWSIEARGRVFTPPRSVTLAPYALAMRSMLYSKDRLLTPLKRVDWDPKGERNPQNRGISGYEPISWDEAFSLVADEIRRVNNEVGSTGVAMNCSSHQLWGNVGYHHAVFNHFRSMIGATAVEANPDSWEGWHWGAMNTWGFSWKLGLPEQCDLLRDALENTELVVFWSSDPETTGGVYSAFESHERRRWLRELGVEMVVIDPYYNHTAVLFCDKWLAPYPGTDAAMATAIAYTWLSEGSYDKEYIERRTVGFEDWADYLLGKTDGTPKTCEWAEAICGVDACDIRALARLWAGKKTMLAAGGEGGFGGACRTAAGNEWARLMVCLAAMQGLGKPGSNIWSTMQGAPVNASFSFPGYVGGVNARSGNVQKIWNRRPLQTIQRLRLPEAILEGHAEWRPTVWGGPIEQQFAREEYPAPGGAEVQMLYSFGGSQIGTMTETNRYVRMYRSEKLRCVVSQAVWFEGETKFADIILPACTNFERPDISEAANSGGTGAATYTQNNYRIIVLQKKCIEPLGDSRSDYEIFSGIAEKLGLREIYTDGGMTEADMVRKMFDESDLPAHISWEAFEEKGYFVIPQDGSQPYTPALRWFAEERDCDTPDTSRRLEGGRLMTPSGKIEIKSSLIEKYAAGEADRPAIPSWVEPWEGIGTDERYPLALMSPHPRFSFHTMGDAKDSWINDIRDHRVEIDGYKYWIARINPVDAAVRGIEDGCLVELYNDRASVICAARVTERVRPGVIHSYGSSAKYDPIGEPGASPDRAGCVNLLTSRRFMTASSSGMACNSCQIEIRKYDGGAK